MQAHMENTAQMITERTMTDFLEILDPKLYWKYDIIGNVKKVFYVELIKSLFIYMRGDLFFCWNLNKKLIGWVFEINSYDWYVTNKVINDNQFTALWHIDDFKVFHL